MSFTRRTAVLIAVGLAFVPFLMGLGVGAPDPVELESLKQSNVALKQENESYRVATGQLAEQISSLQSALTQLGNQSQLDPAAREALERLPAVIRSRAAGGGAISAAPAISAESPDGTFGILKSLLGALETRLASVKSKVESQQALARATPSIWPLTTAWLSSGFGKRTDPFNGEGEDFHSGLDLAADRGTPVHATADGVVDQVGFNGSYGNSVLVNHGYGISTRFGHLSGFTVSSGQHVNRGDVVGYVGSTGRATAPHLHYEILLNGQAINPLRLLAKP